MGSSFAAADNAIAIVGMAGRFPGADSVAALWKLLLNGGEGSRTLTDDDITSALHQPWLQHPDYVRRSACISKPAEFDVDFFKSNLADARMTDPQHRWFLTCCWEALEQAGYPQPEREGLRTGVFGGCSMGTYMINNIINNPNYADRDPLMIMMTNEKDFLCSRVAYQLDLKGPAITVQTACSTSLVAIHQACQSLLSGECDMALAGGAAVNAYGETGYLYTPNGIRSPDGHCRPFDSRAQGTIFGDGVAVVVLKRLQDALQDRDHIVALIAATAVNSDGADKLGFTAPSVSGQQAVITEALDVAGLQAEQLSFVETHGTGTELGDAIEVRALTQAFDSPLRQHCLLGSVKSNVGHLDAASGVTGLIKAALSVYHRRFPGTCHFETPNPELSLEQTPFYLSAKSVALERPLLVGGVSSFGVGGTNAHAIVTALERGL
ncbi:MAG: beta-ketoacyl synthase [Osedax symbiont Rs1]|nr:MAG: beta-ketoacyl synthase [Osedax symbiont Rs1]